MPTRLIELEDGLCVEVTAVEDVSDQAFRAEIKGVRKPFADIQPVLASALKSVADSWDAMGDQVQMEKATLELGLGFSTEGNIFIAKGTATANLTVTFSWAPKAAGS